MIKKRLIITSSLSIVLVAMLLIGSTYSIFTTTEIDEDANVYTTGNLNVTYTLSSSNVQMTDVTPMTPEEADSVRPYRITVKNNGNVPYMFDVILTDTTSSSDNSIDYQYIMTKVGYLEPKKLSNCTNNVIKEDVIVPAGESVDIDVRVWLGSNLSNSEIGKSFYGKLSIDGLAVYDDSTDIDNNILSLRYMKNLFPWGANDYYRNDSYRNYIKNASFVDYIDTSNALLDENNEIVSWDVSESSDNSVVAWLEDDGTTDSEGNSYYNLYIGSKDKIYAINMIYYFWKLTSLESISFDNLDTSLTTNMFKIFSECSSLVNLDVSGFDTKNVTTMLGMFSKCSSLTSIDVSNFDTSNVTEMGYSASDISKGYVYGGMFQGCSNLIYLNLSNFDTSNVTSMCSMFSECSSLINIDLSVFNTNNVTYTEWMFSGCSSLESLDLSNFDTSNVTVMSNMFQNCSSLESLDLSNFDTSNVTNMRGLFKNCSSLISLDLSNFDSSNVTLMGGDFYLSGQGGMFQGCSNLIYLNLSSFDTSNVTDMRNMFNGCSSLVSLDLSSFNTNNVTNMESMFSKCSSLVNIDLRSFNTSNVTNMSNMFNECSNLESLDLSNFDTGNVTIMGSNYNGMFSYCSSLINLNLSSFDTSNVTDMRNMFLSSYKIITTLTIRNANTNLWRLTHNAATVDGSSITLNYTTDTESLVDTMISGNVVKGILVT